MPWSSGWWAASSGRLQWGRSAGEGRGGAVGELAGRRPAEDVAHPHEHRITGKGVGDEQVDEHAIPPREPDEGATLLRADHDRGLRQAHRGASSSTIDQAIREA